MTMASVPSPGVPLGCASNGTIEKRLDVRQAARADFEWKIRDHLLRFGLDHEQNTSDYSYHYSGPDAHRLQRQRRIAWRHAL